MPARDKYHDQFKAALVKDGWIVTHDPLRLEYGGRRMYVDLGAEEVIGAEKGGRKIAVEVKSFLGPSEINDLEGALGQFILYRRIIAKTEPDRRLYLAVPQLTFVELFDEPVGRLLIEEEKLFLVVFDSQQEEIKQWIH
jgi:XisH protein